MPEITNAPDQVCPACGALVNVAEAEPLATVSCPACGATVRVERAFDNFVLVEPLGAGGMGAVYKARDTRLDRLVALKLLRKELSADPIEAARLEQEARVLAAVNHPSVVHVYSSGSAHGQIYLVMELVDHGSLEDLMAKQPQVPEALVLQAGIQVAKGLQAAHEKGLIHRDVKPANILFANAETAKIGDFGLAVAAGHKTEGEAEIWGTPYYVAPERLNNAPEDFRSDIYSLGATLFHALAGQPPIEGNTTSASELRDLKNHPPDLRAIAPQITRPTARVINQMLKPEPSERFGSYAELIQELQLAARPDGQNGGRAKSRGPTIIAGLVVVAVLAVAGFYLMQKKPSAAPISPGAPSASPANNAAAQHEADARKQAEAEKKKLAAEAAERESAEKRAHEAERKKLLDQESPGWQKAQADSRAKIALYDFPAALAAINAANVSEPSLLEAQAAERKKIGWLIEWKSHVIADVKGGRFKAPIQIGATAYQGATKADDARITFQLPPYGTADVDWIKIPPKQLLEISNAMIRFAGAEIADREWLAAVFAYSSAQADAARPLAEAAAKAKPEYREQLKLFSAPAP